jgi:hypothetical protein
MFLKTLQVRFIQEKKREKKRDFKSGPFSQLFVSSLLKMSAGAGKKDMCGRIRCRTARIKSRRTAKSYRTGMLLAGRTKGVVA